MIPFKQKMAPYAVEGVEFTYLRCGDIETYSYEWRENGESSL